MKSANIAAASSLILTLVLAGPVAAGMSGTSGENTGTTSKQSFNNLDQDKNGKLSKQEAEGNPPLVYKWSEVDTNGDGTIDYAEFSVFEVQQMGSGSDTSSGSAGNRPKSGEGMKY